MPDENKPAEEVIETPTVEIAPEETAPESAPVEPEEVNQPEAA
jgi:hypothetical protein